MLSQGQQVLLFITLLSTVYLISLLLHFHALVNKYGIVAKIGWQASLGALFVVSIQTVFILTLTGNIVI